MKKTLIIGASHSGQMAARELRRLDPSRKIILIEKEKTTPFIASGINLVLSGHICDLKEAITAPADLEKIGIKTFFGYKVTKIMWEYKKVYFTNGKNFYEETYDELILATGAEQYLPKKYEGMSKVYSYKSFSESESTLAAIEKSNCIAISGVGYVGLELAESLLNVGKKVVLIGSGQHLVHEYYNEKISDFLKNKFKEKGASLYLENQIIKIEERNKGLSLQLLQENIDCDILIIAKNSRPNSSLYWDRLILLPDKTIKVNQYLQTNYPDVYAIGDLIALPDLITKKRVRLSLVMDALQTGRIAALNIAQKKLAVPEHLDISTTKFFDYYLGSVGLTARKAEQNNLIYEQITVGDLTTTKTTVYIDSQQRLMGAQLIGKQPIQSFLDLIAVLIRSNWTMEDIYCNSSAFFPTYTSFTPLLNEAAGIYLNEK